MTLLFPDLPATSRPRLNPAVETVSQRAWKAAVAVLCGQGGMSERKARIFVGGLLKDGLRHEDLESIAQAALKAGTPDPQGYLAKAARAQASRRRAVSSIEELSDERARAWMRDFIENAAEWREDVRGPMPGLPGCRVPLHIQREFPA